MDEDLIVLGAPAETQAAGGEVSDATEAPEGREAEGAEAATPGTDTADTDAANPTHEPPKGEGEDEAEARRSRSGYQRQKDKIARLEAENASLRSAAPAASEDRASAIEKMIGAAPKEADFDDYVAFEDAKAEYRIAKALATQRVAEREVQASRAQVTAREAAVEAFNDRLDEAREKIPDFDKVVKSAADREVKAHVQDLVVESEKGGLLAYHLAKNPAELVKLNGMSAIQAAKAVGALEHRLTLAKDLKKATTAPAPAKPVAGGAAPSSPDAEIDAYLARTYGGRGR